MNEKLTCVYTIKVVSVALEPRVAFLCRISEKDALKWTYFIKRFRRVSPRQPTADDMLREEPLVEAEANAF